MSFRYIVDNFNAKVIVILWPGWNYTASVCLDSLYVKWTPGTVYLATDIAFGDNWFCCQKNDLYDRWRWCMEKAKFMPVFSYNLRPWTTLGATRPPLPTPTFKCTEWLPALYTTKSLSMCVIQLSNYCVFCNCILHVFCNIFVRLP